MKTPRAAPPGRGPGAKPGIAYTLSDYFLPATELFPNDRHESSNGSSLDRKLTRRRKGRYAKTAQSGRKSPLFSSPSFLRLGVFAFELSIRDRGADLARTMKLLPDPYFPFSHDELESATKSCADHLCHGVLPFGMICPATRPLSEAQRGSPSPSSSHRGERAPPLDGEGSYDLRRPRSIPAIDRPRRGASRSFGDKPRGLPLFCARGPRAPAPTPRCLACAATNSAASLVDHVARLVGRREGPRPAGDA